MDRNYADISNLLQDPSTYAVNVKALSEFLKLHQLGHWSISKLPKEVLILVAQHLGHDAYFANQLLTIAQQEADGTFKLFSDFRKACTPELKVQKFYQLLDQYSCLPKAIETALAILASMKELAPPSLFCSVLSTGPQRIKQRQAQIIRLSELLIGRGVQSPLAFYLRGIHGLQGYGYLLKAKALLVCYDGLNGLNKEQCMDLDLRLLSRQA